MRLKTRNIVIVITVAEAEAKDVAAVGATSEGKCKFRQEESRRLEGIWLGIQSERCREFHQQVSQSR